MDYRIEVSAPPDAPSKQKGDLLESLAADLLRAQSYEVESQLRFTASEIDLLCKHKVSGKRLYVECKAHRDTLSAHAFTQVLGKLHFHNYDEGWLISAGPLGKDAKGFKSEWEQKPPGERQRLSIYDAGRVISALTDAGLICTPPLPACTEALADNASPGDWTLLISGLGRFWTCTCLSNGVPAGALVFDASSGKLVSDLALLRRLAKEDSSAASLDLELASRIDTTAPHSKPQPSPPAVVEVKYGETWDDYRPARPEHFVGRHEAQGRILRYLRSVRERNTDTRVFAVTGDTGMGKSSLITKLRSRLANKRWRRQFFMFAADVRAAHGPSYIPAALLEGLRRAASEGFGVLPTAGLSVSTHADPLASPTLQQYLTSLSDRSQVVCIVFDQFEELYSKPELFPIFEEAQRLFLSAAAATSNLVVGFVLRSDSTVQQDHPAYYLWHQLADHRFETRLRVFSPPETAAALTLFEQELGQPLRPELRRQISENSEGYPWLLKKLCIHLYEQIRNGTDQGDLDETMDVESLFDNDLNACTSAERTCLQLVAKQSPADWYEILEVTGTDVVRALQDKRLIVRNGDRLNLYWDVFREFVLTKKVPSIPFTYLPSSPSIGSFLSVAARLDRDQPANREHISESTGLSVKTVGNVLHDLVMFGVARGRPSAIFADARMDSCGEHEVLKRVRLIFKRHALYRKLAAFEDGSVITLDDLVAALKDTNPSAMHRQSTWEIYAERLGPWLVASGLLQVSGSGWVLRDAGQPCVPSKRGSRFRIGCFLGDAPPARVVEVLEWLSQSQPVTPEQIDGHAYRNAIRVLDRLELTGRDEDGRYLAVNDCETISAESVVWHAASEDETLQSVWEFVKLRPTAGGIEIGNHIALLQGQQWTDASKMRTGNAVRAWAIWIGRGKSLEQVPVPPGPRVRKQKDSGHESLFNKDHS